MSKPGTDAFNAALVDAAAGGHLELVKLIIEQGAGDFDAAMWWAAEGGHL